MGFVKSLFGGDEGIIQQAPPTIEPPPVMPVADDKAVKDAERRKRAALAKRSGRQSTILSQNEPADPLGV